MLRRRSTITTIALAVTLALGAAVPQALAASASQDQEKVTLLVWDQWTEAAGEAADQVYASFMDEHPNIEIKREVATVEGQLRETAKTALASGTGPDVIYYDVGPGFVGVLADAGLLLPLDEMAAQYGWNERVYQSAKDWATLDGQFYGLPLGSQFLGLYYNQTLLTEAGLTVPETAADLLTFCADAKAKGYIPLAYGNNPGWQAFHQFAMTANNMLGPEGTANLLFNNQGRWDSPELITAMKLFFVDMQAAGCFIPDANAVTYDDAASVFYAGQALMLPTGSWLVSDIETNAPDQEFGIVPFPAIEGGQGRVLPAGVGSAYYISAKSAHPAEAGMLLDHIIAESSVQTWVEDGQVIPPVPFDASAWELSPLFRFVVDTLQSAGQAGTASPTAGGSPELGYYIDLATPEQFNTVMQDGFQAMLAGDKTAELQAVDLQAAWEAGRQ